MEIWNIKTNENVTVSFHLTSIFAIYGKETTVYHRK